MINLLENIHLALPQMIVLATGCIALMISLFEKEHQHHGSYAVTLIGLFLSMVVSLSFYGTSTETILGGEFISDNLSQVLTTSIAGTVFLVLLYSRDYMIERQMPMPDILGLISFSTVGMMVLVSANSILTSYLGLELLSLPLYALTAVRRTEGDASEAAMKYFVMGALASGMLLFGFSLIYAATGKLGFTEIALALSHQTVSGNAFLTFGLVFIVAGLGFKLALVPFHMWAPDVYQGAPLSVTLLLSTAPKIAGLAFMIRLLTVALPVLSTQWHTLLLVMTLLSIGFGNVFAVAQNNIRRLFAYSAISHMGFAVFGIMVANPAGYASAVYYMLVYVMMTVAAFGLLVLLSREGIEIENIDDLKGLNQKNAWAPAMMMIIMFSMAGVPPTAGFFIKLAVLKVLVDASLTWMAILAVLFAVIGAFYYLRVVKVMYFDDAHESTPTTLGNGVLKICFSLNCLALLYFGLFPSSLITMCSTIFMS